MNASPIFRRTAWEGYGSRSEWRDFSRCDRFADNARVTALLQPAIPIGNPRIAKLVSVLAEHARPNVPAPQEVHFLDEKRHCTKLIRFVQRRIRDCLTGDTRKR
jgi:hypothetical protein